MQIRSIGLALVLAAATSNAAFAQVLFRMDYSAAASPSGGWPGTVGSAATHTTTRVEGGGPQGESSYDMVQRYTGPSVSGFGGEYDWGWNGDLEASDPPAGSRRYYRWRMRFTPDTNFRGVYSNDGSPTTLTNKILIVGDGCGSNCRVILSYRGGGANGRPSYWRVALDGGVDPADIQTNIPANGTWFNVQLEVTTGASGGYKLWINNNNYASPNASMRRLVNPTRHRYVFFGAYNNNGLESGGIHAFRHTGFEVATAFDSSWHRGSTLPATPGNLRILPPQ
jgi:hypothetical protein